MLKKAPLGVKILGGVNAFFLGLFSLFFSLRGYFNENSSFHKKLLDISREQKISFHNVDPQMLKIIFLIQIVIALIFLTSGAGILRKQEWARKLTIYFSFAILILAALSALANPALIKHLLFNIIYSTILIFYFTNKKIEGYFIDKCAA